MSLASRLLPFLAGAFALAPSALALDCAKASSDVDKAICADPELKATEDAMDAAYQAVLPKLSAEQQAAMKTGQDGFLKARADYCSAEDGRKDCLMSRTTPRIAFLTAKPESGPGFTTAPLPFSSAGAQTKTTCAYQIDLHKFPGEGNAGEAAFNTSVEAIAKAMGDEFGAREDSPDFQYDCNYNLSSAITYASADLVAAELYFDAYQGGAHGIYGRRMVVTDLKSGKPADIAGLFDKAALTTLTELCTASLREEKLKRYEDAESGTPSKETTDQIAADLQSSAETIAKTVADPATWIVYEDRAEIYFEPYAVGPYAEGEFVCTLPKATLQKAAGAKGWIVP